MKIFLLENNYSLNREITNILENKGFFVTNIRDGYEAMTNILNNYYDLYILNTNAIGFNGYEILEEIRKNQKDEPIIIISEEFDIESISKAYDLGCNDYIKKPFEVEELLLHIKYHIKTVLNRDTNKDLIDLGFGFKFLTTDKTLYKESCEVELTPKERLLLNLFLNNLNKTVSLDMIHGYVWSNKKMEPVSIRSMIHKLQKKLDSSMIKNIRGVGYKLIIEK